MNRRQKILLAGASAAFDPESIGVLGAWFDVGQASDAGSGLTFTLPNRLSANHATTTVDAQKPTIGTASNGVPILTCATAALGVTLHAAINDATKWGLAFHGRITSAAGNPVPFSIDSGGGMASTRKCFGQRFSGDNITVHDAASPTTLARRFGAAGAWELNTWRHYCCELNLDSGEAEEDRGLWRVDGLPIVSTFVDALGSPGALPTAMAVPTGLMVLLAQRTTGLNPWVGDVANIMIFNAAMPGARTLLTDAAALNLSTFNRPA